MSFFLVWILATALKQIVIELSAQTTMLKLLTEQQDGGYRLVIDQLLDKLKGDDVAKQ